MKESYIEGLANHNGPESGAGSRKATGEAMIGVRTGEVLSRENSFSWVPTSSAEAEGNMGMHRDGKGMSDPARSKPFGMCENSMCENRESLHPSSRDGSEERVGKNELQEPAKNGCRQSDSPVLPAKLPNKVGETGLRRQWREGD